MKLAPNVKVKTFPWTVIPLFSTYTAHAIYPNVYLPRHIFNNLLTNNPRPEYVSVLIHEQTHITRQKRMGWFIWGLRYCLFPLFRFEEEIAAITQSMKYLKTYGLTWDTKRSAKFLSSYLYLWCVDFHTAKKTLDRIWKSIPTK
jgi:hypothetical protein